MNIHVPAGMRSWLLAALLFAVGAAQAQLFRAYLSKDGNDANPCTLAAPCRLLPAALTAVADGGEIWMLDSANYNTSTVSIGKSVSILAVPGVVGSVLAISGNAITISASSLKVALRNLVVVPLPGGGGIDGVQMGADSVLTVENCLFANLTTGIFISAGKLRLANSTLRDMATTGLGVWNGATADVSGSQFLDDAGGGLEVFSGSAVTTSANVSDSIFSGNQFGVSAYVNVTGGVARINVTRSSFQDNQKGLSSATSGAGMSTSVTCSSCMITGNSTYGWYQSGTGAFIYSLGNNHITDNAGNSGALTSTPPL